MATLSSLVTEIDSILDDSAYTEDIIVSKINDAVSAIAAGVIMPDNTLSPPLPDLYTIGSITTSLTLSYVSLPADYQRNVTLVIDSDGVKVDHPSGGNYYSFAKFLKQTSNLNLTESGSVYRVAIKGSKIYYQGIPTVATVFSLHYYKKPTDMVADDDAPEGLPDHLQRRLIKHYVLKEIMGEKIEDGQDNTGIGTKYHASKFAEAMKELINFIGVDSLPLYYGSDDSEDYGVCD